MGVPIPINFTTETMGDMGNVEGGHRLIDWTLLWSMWLLNVNSLETDLLSKSQ